MRPAEYESNVRAAVANKLLADKTIEDLAQRYWFEIDMRLYRFERAEEEAAAMRGVKQAELVRWMKACLLSKHARRLNSVVHARAGPAAGSGSAEAAGKEAAKGAAATRKAAAKRGAAAAKTPVDDADAFRIALGTDPCPARPLPAVAPPQAE